MRLWDLVFFVWYWWSRESMLWDSSTFSEFHTSLSKVLILIKLRIIQRTYNLIKLWLECLVMLQNGKKTKSTSEKESSLGISFNCLFTYRLRRNPFGQTLKGWQSSPRLFPFLEIKEIWRRNYSIESVQKNFKWIWTISHQR